MLGVGFQLFANQAEAVWFLQVEASSQLKALQTGSSAHQAYCGKANPRHAATPWEIRLLSFAMELLLQCLPANVQIVLASAEPSLLTLRCLPLLMCRLFLSYTAQSQIPPAPSSTQPPSPPVTCTTCSGCHVHWPRHLVP